MIDIFEIAGFEITQTTKQRGEIVLEAVSTKRQTNCPDCQQPSQSVHSYYTRHPNDLPVFDQAVQWQLRVRRFRCRNKVCRRQTFAERLDELVAFRAQRTKRLTARLRAIGLALGGEAGARLLVTNGLRGSADTLLRLIRQQPVSEPGLVPHLGVDDGAMRKGQVDGTILVDLDRRQPIDLRQDREAATLAVWLKDHPEVTIITRDRAGAYADGARQGAPQATQVADRWHLLKNLTDVLTLSLEPDKAAFQSISLDPELDAPTQTSPLPGLEPDQTGPAQTKKRARPLSPQQQRRQARRAEWVQRFAEVHALHDQGLRKLAIARQTGLAIRTVRKYLRLTERPPKTSSKPGPRLLDPYRPYLKARLATEPVTVAQLWAELKAQGFSGGKTIVCETVSALRRELGLPGRSTAVSAVRVKPPRLTARSLAFLILRRPDRLTLAQAHLIQQVRQAHPALQPLVQLSQDFAAILRNRQVERFDDWSLAVDHTQSPALIGFVKGLRQDERAVRAALTLPFSNDQTAYCTSSIG